MQTPKQDVTPSATVTPTLTSTTTPTSTNTPTSTATPNMYYVGETASDGVVNITLNGLRYTSVINERNLVKAQPGNMFVILDITLEIIKAGDVRLYAQGGPFRVRSSNGYLYTTHQKEYEALNKGLVSNQNLTYGDKTRGELAFEIPETSNSLTFQFLFDPDNRVTFDLGDTPTSILSTTTPTASEPIIISGRGNKATELFYLSEGLIRFESEYNGERNFIILLMDDQGRKISLVVNEIGSVQGSKAIRIEKAGMYLMYITADGTWKVTIT